MSEIIETFNALRYVHTKCELKVTKLLEDSRDNDTCEAYV